MLNPSWLRRGLFPPLSNAATEGRPYKYVVFRGPDVGSAGVCFVRK